MNTTITINDPDRNVDYELAVDFDILRPDPSTGDRGGVEVNRVLVESITTWCGKYGIAGTPEGNEAKACGAWCLERYREEICDAVIGQIRNREGVAA